MVKNLEIAEPLSAVPVMHPAINIRSYNQSDQVDLHRHEAAKPPSRGVASLAKHGSSPGLDTKESKDCF